MHHEGLPGRGPMRDRIGSAELLTYGNGREISCLPIGNVDIRQKKGENRSAGINGAFKPYRNKRAKRCLISADIGLCEVERNGCVFIV